MKQYFLKIAGAMAVLALINTVAAAQDDQKAKEATSTRHSEDVIIIRPKAEVKTKLTIEINGSDVMINGKSIDEFKNDDVNISRRKSAMADDRRGVEVQGYPSTRFRSYGGGNSYSYNGSDNLAPRVVTGMSYNNSNKAMLGVGTEKVDDGVSISSVSDESAAEKAGLKKGDIITKINDTKITTPEELRKEIGKYKPDDKITVTYKREKKEQKATAVLTKSKNQAITLNSPDFREFKNFNFDNGSNFNFNWGGKPRLGLKAQETEDGKGLKVLDVDDESTAEKAGIKEGDIITVFDGAEVNTVDKLGELAKTAIEKGTFKVKLTRDGKAQEIDVKIPKKLKSTSL